MLLNLEIGNFSKADLRVESRLSNFCNPSLIQKKFLLN